MNLVYPVCLYPGEKSGYVAVVPDLPGCVTQGETIEDALDMAVDAASGWVLDELEDGNQVPEPSPVKDIKADEYADGIVSVVKIDLHRFDVSPFDALMSFSEASEKWGIDDSTLRKAVSSGKLVENVDVRKFGKQWVIAGDSMRRVFGDSPRAAV